MISDFVFNKALRKISKSLKEAAEAIDEIASFSRSEKEKNTNITNDSDSELIEKAFLAINNKCPSREKFFIDGVISFYKANGYLSDKQRLNLRNTLNNFQSH